MKKPGILAALTLLLAIVIGAASAQAADNNAMIRNDSQTTVTVSIVWSGGHLPPFKIGPGESVGLGSSETMTVPPAINSVKMRVTGKCREAAETFNPQHVNRAVIDCKDGGYTIKLEQTKPVS